MRLLNKISSAQAVGGAGVVMVVLGTLGAGGALLAIVRSGIDSGGAGLGVALFGASGAVAITGVVCIGVGYGRAAHFKKKYRVRFAVVPALRPGGGGLRLAARW